MSRSDAQLGALPDVSKELSQFPERLRKVIGEESLRSFAKKCALSEGVLRSYLRGDTYPSLDRLIIIARVGDVGVEWLATGETLAQGQEVVTIDEEFLIRVALVVDSVLRERKIEIGSLVHKLRLYTFIYDRCLATKHIDLEMMNKIISLAAPSALDLIQDAEVLKLIENLSAIGATDPVDKGHRFDQWWCEVAEKFQAPGFLIPAKDKGKVISWLEDELSKRLESVDNAREP